MVVPIANAPHGTRARDSKARAARRALAIPLACKTETAATAPRPKPLALSTKTPSKKIAVKACLRSSEEPSGGMKAFGVAINASRWNIRPDMIIETANHAIQRPRASTKKTSVNSIFTQARSSEVAAPISPALVMLVRRDTISASANNKGLIEIRRLVIGKSRFSDLRHSYAAIWSFKASTLGTFSTGPTNESVAGPLRALAAIEAIAVRSTSSTLARTSSGVTGRP